MPGDSPETIGHAELEIGTGMIMLADEFPDHGFLSPQSVGGTPVTIHVYVGDVDATYAKALDAGATSVREVENQFYGDRSGQFEDPFGHRWNIASHVEEVSPEEMGRRMAEMAQGSTRRRAVSRGRACRRARRSRARWRGGAWSTFFSSASASASPSSAAARRRS